VTEARSEPRERARLAPLCRRTQAVRRPEKARNGAARGLDLERDELARAPGHQVELAVRRAHAAAQHAPSETGELARREPLAELAQLPIVGLRVAREQPRRPGQRQRAAGRAATLGEGR